MRARSLGLAALLGLSAFGCGLVASCDAWTVSSEHDSGGGQLASTLSLLDLMVGATERVEFQGVRRYEAHWTDASGAHSLVYREQVSSDGTGRYAVDPLELIEPQLDPAPEAQFLLVQKVRERLLFRYRDFEIRDLDVFSANYQALFSGQTTTVAGRAAEQITVMRQVAPDRRYLLDVDVQNGLVLRARETLLDGTLLALSEFEGLDLTPDLSGVVFSQPVAEEDMLPPGSVPCFDELGFSPLVPKSVPTGWSLIELSRLVDPTDGRAWAKMVYSDGVELIFFLSAAPPRPKPVVWGTPDPPPKPDRVRSLSVGAWTLLQGDVAGRALVVMGRRDELFLADLIRSSLP